jgi:hypothetical protein
MLMTRALSIVATAAACLLSVACLNLEDPAPSTRSQLVVHAVLDVEAAQQIVLVFRARTGTQDTSIVGATNDQPVSGARVTITGPNGTSMTAVETIDDTTFSPTPGSYVFVPSRAGFVLSQGATYSLHVRTPSGEEVSGTTTIPQARLGFTIVPPKTFRRLQDTLRLSWPRASGARSYEVIIRSPRSDEYRIFADTSIVVPGTQLTVNGDPVFPRNRPVEVLVSAVDMNYYDYYRAQSDPFAGAAPSHLVGAVGVFGAVVPLLLTDLQIQ